VIETGRRVTIKHVASRAGVSFGVAARILRRDPSCHVLEGTRQRVLAAAQELGYAPNPFAQTLRTGKTHFIGLLSGSTHNNLTSQRKVDTILQRLADAGYQVIMERCERCPERFVPLLREFMRIRPCALLIAFGPDLWGPVAPPDVQEELLQLRDSGVPVVGVDAEWAGDWVTVDRRAGFYRGTRYLTELGHRRIAFLGHIPPDRMARLPGYRAALEEAGIPFDPELVIPLPPELRNPPVEYRWGQSNATELLARQPDVTAVVCLNDRVAMGAVKAALRLGRRVPEDLSVMGCDGDPEAEFAAVAVSSLRQPVEEMADTAVRLLLEGLGTPREEAARRPIQQFRLEPSLIRRESCGPPPRPAAGERA